MSQIRQIHIKNFRSLKNFIWSPSPGLNCLIGSGDTGKSTILDAIDITLGARRSYQFSDSDFYQLDTNTPIEIWITLGKLADELKNIELYAKFLRGFDSSTSTIIDEPKETTETVITIKLTVRESLNPDWLLYSNRAEMENYERGLMWKHRELIAPVRLDVASNYHLSWSNLSVLNKFSEKSFDVSALMANIFRQIKETFSNQQPEHLSEVLNEIKEIACSLGIPIDILKAQLDIRGNPLSKGLVGLHNGDNIPLRQLGTGSTRLLISGLHQATSNSKILLVDEADYGLEPFRISRLLHELGSKKQHASETTKQVFITTHSPYVLTELNADQLHVVRRESTYKSTAPSHKIFHLNAAKEQEQATLRACADSFLSRRVIVCEGKTEIGLIRGLDLFFQENGKASIFAHGTSCANGGGDTMFYRATIFSELEYPTAIFKDSDKDDKIKGFSPGNVEIFQWPTGLSTEEAIFKYCPWHLINSLLDIAIERKTRDGVDTAIKNKSGNKFTLDNYGVSVEDTDFRNVLGSASKKCGWFKDIEPMENIGRSIIAPNYETFDTAFTEVLTRLFEFARGEAID